jgi:hypothetical protein
MLDDVDLIAGVSGGSFTELAYALYGERLFHEYQQRFLKRNVQGELILSLQLPIVTTAGSVTLCCRSGFRTLRTESTRPARLDERCCAIVISRRSRTARAVPTYTSSMAGSQTTTDCVACSKRSSNWRRVPRSNARCASPNCDILSSSRSIRARLQPPIGIESLRRPVLCRS